MDRKFPDDKNGRVLRRMQIGGDDLSKPRDIDFSVVFQEENLAFGFIETIREKFDNISYEKIADGEVDVTVSRFMLPDHTEISNIEKFLEISAAEFAGNIDGWGCFKAE